MCKIEAVPRICEKPFVREAIGWETALRARDWRALGGWLSQSPHAHNRRLFVLWGRGVNLNPLRECPAAYNMVSLNDIFKFLPLLLFVIDQVCPYCPVVKMWFSESGTLKRDSNPSIFGFGANMLATISGFVWSDWIKTSPTLKAPCARGRQKDIGLPASSKPR